MREEPNWQPFEEYDGKTLERVRVQDLLEPPGVLVQLVEIAAGGSFAMHSSPDVAFCQMRPSLAQGAPELATEVSAREARGAGQVVNQQRLGVARVGKVSCAQEMPDTRESMHFSASMRRATKTLTAE